MFVFLYVVCCGSFMFVLFPLCLVSFRCVFLYVVGFVSFMFALFPLCLFSFIGRAWHNHVWLFHPLCCSVESQFDILLVDAAGDAEMLCIEHPHSVIVLRIVAERFNHTALLVFCVW